MNNSRLGGVVHGLQLRNVDNAAAHRRRGNEAARHVIVQRLAVERRALLLLPAKVPARALGAPHDAVDVDLHDLARLVGGPVDKGAVLPGDARVGHKDVEAAVELLDNLSDGLVDGFGGCDVDLVCLACNACVNGVRRVIL